MLTARSPVKVIAALDPAALLDLTVPDGQPRLALLIQLPDRTLSASISAKSARRAIAAIREHGADAVAAIVQGWLTGTAVTEAGLSVQPKGPVKAPKQPAPRCASRGDGMRRAHTVFSA